MSNFYLFKFIQMKKVFLFMMAAIVIASMSVVMANVAMNNAQSSSVTVDDPNGTYLGTCYNVDMNGDTDIPPVSDVEFVVKSEGGTVYRFDGDITIIVDDPIEVKHVIHVSNVQFNVNPRDGEITYLGGDGTIQIWVDGLYVGEYDFNVDILTGDFSGDDLNFHFEADVPLFYIADFHASFDYSGTK
jgi:hypothetical protein